MGRAAVLVALCTSLVLGVGSAQAAPGAGALDPSFGVAGTDVLPLGSGSTIAQAVVVQPDGKIVVAGDTNNGADLDLALARVNPNGSLDTGFGSDGYVTTSIGSADDVATSLALQPDGKLLSAGYSFNATTSDDFALVRYSANGSLDTGFGTGGKATTDILGSADEANAVVLQPDGKIVAAGQTFDGSHDDFAVVRYNANGSLDTGFTGGGAAITPIGPGEAVARALALQPDGKIVAAGWSLDGSNFDFTVVRYTANGGLDGSFGTSGEVTTHFGTGNDQALAVAVQPDGKIVVAGFNYTGAADFAAVARYNSNGSLDTGFGTGGIVTIPSGLSQAFGLALQPDGKIILAGQSSDGTKTGFGVVRLNANGSLDSGFGSGGIVFAPFGPGGAEADGVALQPDGKIVAAGSADAGGNSTFAIARLLGNTLSVAENGNGFGTVNSNPAGISCGSTCSASFAAGPVITLTATPQAGSAFSGWSGAGCAGTVPCHVQLGGDQQVTATFTLVKTLTVTEAGKGSGIVTSKPAGIQCSPSCAHTFAAGTSVTLTAGAARGSVFAGWSGGCSDAVGRICTVQMDADHDVTAAFSLRCVVPQVKGKRLAAAERAIKTANCSVGTVTTVFSASVRKGRIVSESPRPGTLHAGGSKVNLTVSKGRRH